MHTRKNTSFLGLFLFFLSFKTKKFLLKWLVELIYKLSNLSNNFIVDSD